MPANALEDLLQCGFSVVSEFPLRTSRPTPASRSLRREEDRHTGAVVGQVAAPESATPSMITPGVSPHP